MEISKDGLNLLFWLAPGFLAFRFYKIDADWRSIHQVDVIYGSLIFSVLGYAALYPFRGYIAGFGESWLIITALFSAVPIAAFWKVIGHRSLHRVLHKVGYTNEDNCGDVWQKIFNEPKIYVTQINAYMKNGEAIACDNTLLYDTPELRSAGIYPYYSHRDRQICFIPNRRKKSDGDWIELQDVSDIWGTRIVYINPDELQRLEVRVAPTGHDTRWWKKGINRLKASARTEQTVAQQESSQCEV